MASRQKNRPRATRKSSDVLSKLGISLDMPDFNENEDVSDADEDYESELQALLTGNSAAKPVKPRKSAANAVDIDKMVAVCMRNPSVEDGDDVSGDEMLLAELQGLTKETSSNDEDSQHDSSGVSEPASNSSVINIIQERLHMYQEAETVVKNIGDNSKARRYGRAIKTLKDLLLTAKSGANISEDDIPPVVPIPKIAASSALDVQNSEPANVKVCPTLPSRPAPSIPKDSSLPGDDVMHQAVSRNTSAQLVLRRNQYKVAALNAKKCGDNETVMEYVKIAKKFDVVIAAVENGQSVDLSNMPPFPPKYTVNTPSHISSSAGIAQHTKSENMQISAVATEMEEAAIAAANEPADPGMFSAPEAPATILEALEQRLEKYCSTRDTAKNEGNNSKVRRLQRIIQQYESAIKNHKAGKPVDFSELPIPPGFAPIPSDEQSASSPTDSKNNKRLSDETPLPPKAKNIPSEPLPSSKTAQPGPSSSQNTDLPPKGKHPRIQRANTSTILEKQLNFLLERQKLFRQAALESKKNGDIQQAKEYLRMSKGFDSMIEATKSGLPIDATTIPTPPQLEADFVVIDKTECFDESSEENIGFFPNLEKELQHQIEMCTRNKDHFMRLGDVSSASKFEKLGLDTKKDLAVIQIKSINNEQVPSFHYEMRLFSLVQCNTDLADNEVEVTVERGINLPGKPDDLDAYVKIEFPIPTESPQRARTHTIKDTNNPIYQEVFKFEINRKSRSQLRQFKRQTLKFEVWSKSCSCLCLSGFFRSDVLLGTVLVKLVDLETKCVVHDSFDLLDGRKLCGGKLEIKIRLRDPLLTKQIEEVKEKWLVIGS